MPQLWAGACACSVGWVKPGLGREGGRVGLQFHCFGACCKSQKTCVGFDVHYLYGCVLAGVSSLHMAAIFTVFHISCVSAAFINLIFTKEL